MQRTNVNKTIVGLVAVGALLAACGADDSASDSSATELDSGRSGDGVDAGNEAGNDAEAELTQEAAPNTEAPAEATAELESGDDAAPAIDIEAAEQDGGLFGDESVDAARPAPDPDVEAPPGDNRFEDYGYREFIAAADDPLSTFALDVDTGSYSIGRRFIDDGLLPPRESVRPEEYVNAFDYDYDVPRTGLAISVDGGPSPFAPDNVLIRVGVQGEVVDERDRSSAALTFVIDTSGSMDRPDRLGLVKESLILLVDELEDDDTVAIVTYSDSSGVVLEPTAVRNRDRIIDAIDELGPGGSTNLESGLREGYALAREAFNEGGINRVVLASDGVANAGITDPDLLAAMLRDDADFGIDLVTVGFGMSSFNDVTMEQLADNGDGFYAYVDTIDEAERLFAEDLTSTLVTIAKDAKIQVEFDEEFVESYRLIGFENRGVRDSDFRNDSVDAGELGAGHQVTALYELRLADGVRLDDRAELGVVSLRWEDPAAGLVDEIDQDIDLRDIDAEWADTPDDFQLATIVATFAEKLRDNPYADEVDIDDLADEAERLADIVRADDVDELAELIARAARLS